MQRLEPFGTLVSFGNSSDEPASFDVPSFYRQKLVSVHSFMVFNEVPARDTSRDLRALADEIAAGRLDTGISLQASWNQADGAIEALMKREVSGKAVLTVD